MPPAVRIIPSPGSPRCPGPIGIVTAGWMSGSARLADVPDAPALQATSAFTMPRPVDDDRVGHHGVGPPAPRHAGSSHAVAEHLAAAEFHFLAIGGVVALDLDPQLGAARRTPSPSSGRTSRHRPRRGESRISSTEPTPTLLDRGLCGDVRPHHGRPRAPRRHRALDPGREGLHHLRRGGEVRRRQGDPRRHGPEPARFGRGRRHRHHQRAHRRPLGHRQGRRGIEGRAHLEDRQGRQSRHPARRHDPDRRRAPR